MVPSAATTYSCTFQDPQPDAAYALSVTPNWLTSSATISKTAEGFTVRFEQPAAPDTAIDWTIVR